MNVMPHALRTGGIARTGLAACALIAAVTLSGCGAGQQSQTASQEPGVNGTSDTVDNIALRDVRLVASQTSDSIQPGKTVDLMFTATNQNPDTPDRLLGITSDIGTVTIAGDAAVPPLGSLVVATPDSRLAMQLSSVAAVKTATATLALNKPISNGLSYTFTFTFEKAGPTTFPVPIAAGPGQTMANQAPGGEH